MTRLNFFDMKKMLGNKCSVFRLSSLLLRLSILVFTVKWKIVEALDFIDTNNFEASKTSKILEETKKNAWTFCWALAMKSWSRQRVLLSFMLCFLLRSRYSSRCYETITLELYYEVSFKKKTHFNSERQRKHIVSMFVWFLNWKQKVIRSCDLRQFKVWLKDTLSSN